MKTARETSKIHLAATRRKPMSSLRRVLGGRMVEFFRDGLRGLPEPDQPAKKREYYDAVADISAKTMAKETEVFLEIVRRRLGKPDLTLSAHRVVSKIAILRRHLEICAGAQDQAGYAAFLARDGFGISEFANAMGLFCKREDIPFQRLPETKIRARRRLLSLSKDPDIAAMRKMIRLLRAHLPNAMEFPEDTYQIISLLGANRSKARNLLEQDHPEAFDELERNYVRGNIKSAGVLFMRKADADSRWSVLRDLIHLGLWIEPGSGRLIRYNESFRLNGTRGYVAADPKEVYSLGMEGISCRNELMISDKAIVQHELQHIFDNFALLEDELGRRHEWEMRALLAELAFSETRIMLAAALMNGNDSQNGNSENEIAWARLKRLIKEENPKTSEQVIAFAKRLLNQEYLNACGLSYDGILEPFSARLVSD